MNAADFNSAFEYTVQNEGYYSNNPADRGGPTKFGITINTLSAWRKKAVTPSDVQMLGRDEAKAIYKTCYWDLLNCDSLTQLPVATAVFDMGVLFGTHCAALYAQEAVGVAMDGVIGPETVKALNLADVQEFLTDYNLIFKDKINNIISRTANQAVFRSGWNNRVDRFLSLIT